MNRKADFYNEEKAYSLKTEALIEKQKDKMNQKEKEFHNIEAIKTVIEHKYNEKYTTEQIKIASLNYFTHFALTAHEKIIGALRSADTFEVEETKEIKAPQKENVKKVTCPHCKGMGVTSQYLGGGGITCYDCLICNLSGKVTPKERDKYLKTYK